MEKKRHFLVKNWLSVILVVSILTWLGTSIVHAFEDIITGQFDHKWLSIPFITTILSGGYLKGRDFYLKRKTKNLGEPKKKPTECKKCGKKKPTNV